MAYIRHYHAGETPTIVRMLCPAIKMKGICERLWRTWDEQVLKTSKYFYDCFVLITHTILVKYYYNRH